MEPSLGQFWCVIVRLTNSPSCFSLFLLVEIQTNENKQDKKLIEVIMLKQLEFGEAAENE